MDGNIKRRTGMGSLFSLLVLLTASRCEEKPFAAQNLTFVFPITIAPSSSLISIGDTLWIEGRIQDSLLEFNTNKKIKLANFDFGQTSIVIRRLIDKQKGLSDQASAVINFDLIDTNGQITFPGETFVDFKFDYSFDKQEYLLKVGIVAKQTGVYCINFLSPQELFYGGKINLGRANNGATILPIYEDLVFPINDGDNNFILFIANCLDLSDGLDSNYRANHRFVTFTFEVQ